jgi:polysaccharide chain length determinant protein (PEP-CTERM system associated)
MQPGSIYAPPGGSAPDSGAVPRRQLDVEDLIEIVRRNKGWIAGPALAGLVVAVVVAFLWPDTYVSSAVIRVVPPQIPERLVPTNVNIAMSARVNAMAQTILSRATLRSVIETYGLYPRERARMPMEDVVGLMRQNIDIGRVETLGGDSRRGDSLSAFRISFRYENRFLAQKVTQDLASRFISENQRQRALQSTMTTQFLREQWLSAKRNLDELEQKLTEYRIRHMGRLPDQRNATIQKLTALEARVTTLNGAIARLEQEKLVANSEMQLLRDRIDGILHVRPEEPRAVADPRLAALDQRIRESELNLARLLESYKPNHPDVIRFKAQIEVLRREREEYLKAQAQPAAEQPEARQLTPEQAREVRELNNRIATMQIQIQARDMQIAEHQREIERVNAQMEEARRAMQVAPADEQEYISLMREVELAKRTYNDLNLKMQQSEIATDLENRKQGETLEMLDQASLPERPSEPKRHQIVLFGLGGGLVVGGLLVFAREVKDTTLKTLKDVRAYTRLAVLGSVPLLENDLVVMRRRRIAWLAWSAACFLSLVIMAGAIYYYYATKV